MFSGAKVGIYYKSTKKSDIFLKKILFACKLFSKVICLMTRKGIMNALN